MFSYVEKWTSYIISVEIGFQFKWHNVTDKINGLDATLKKRLGCMGFSYNKRVSPKMVGVECRTNSNNNSSSFNTSDEQKEAPPTK